MRAVVLKKTGNADVLKITNVEKPKIKEHDVLIRVAYSGINYADLLSRQGLYSWSPKRPYILGLEVSGTIEQVGASVKSFIPGDEVVVGTQSGGYAEYIAMNENFVLRKPNHLNMKEAATYPVNFFTAWVTIVEMGRLKEGEKILVQSAAGGVGTAAVTIGSKLGHKVFGTTGSPHKEQIIKKLGGIPLSYDNFDDKLRETETFPEFILEMMGGEVFNRSLDILSPLGKLVSIGATSIQVNKFNPISVYNALKSIPSVKYKNLLRSGKGFFAVHVGYLLNKPDVLRPMWEQMNEFTEKHKLRPIIEDSAVFSLETASEAHKYIHSRKNIGKVLLKVN